LDYRNARISEEIKRELSNIIRNDLKDPRIPILLSITDVEVTKDLKYSTVYVSILGNEEEKSNALEGLKRAAGYIRKEIGNRVQIRYTPQFTFKLDNSIEDGMIMDKLINDTIKHDKSLDEIKELENDSE